MDNTRHRHHTAMDDTIRNYYGNVHAGRERGHKEMDRLIHQHYGPADRRSAVLRNYYGGGKDGPRDMVKRHYHRLEHVLGNYYGHMDLYKTNVPATPPPPAPAAIVLAKSFDDGEILQQPPFEEYVVMSSMEEEPFEEYVVMSSVDEEAGEEYIVYSQSTDEKQSDPSDPMDLDAYDKEVLKELHIDISNPLAAAKSMEDSPSPAVQAVPIIPATKGPEEDEFLADMASIMSKLPPALQQQARDILPQPSKAQSQPPPQQAPAALPPQNEHAIFDRIARSMQYANAYDLGTVELDNRFADFDKYYDQKEQAKAPPAVTPQVMAVPAAPAATTAAAMDMPDPMEMIKDLDSIFRGGGNQANNQQTQDTDAFFSLSDPVPNDPNWPPKPKNIRQYTSAERAAKFTEFQYLPDPSTYNGDGIKILNDWESKNIMSVDIPQLKTLNKGKMQFHRLGATQLQDLFKAWEDAGLMDRVISFDGSHAARYIRHTEDRNPRPLSNHSWGTAFDINAGQNVFGSEPALVGQSGCVRELVEIANQHGFYWGGHFSPHKDGMHFELGKIIS